MLNDKEKFMIIFEEIIDENEEDIESIATYLKDKYSNMDLDKDYYIDYLKKIL